MVRSLNFSPPKTSWLGLITLVRLRVLDGKSKVNSRGKATVEIKAMIGQIVLHCLIFTFVESIVCK